MISTPSDEVPPEARPFPFADLLADLRHRGFGVGLREYREVAKLASRWEGVDRTVFRDALAALLARDAVEVDGIREAFDEWADSHPPAPLQASPTPRSWTWHIVAVVLVVIGVATYFIGRPEKEQPSVTNVTPPPVSELTSNRPPPPQLPDPPRDAGRQTPWATAAAAAIAALLVLAARESRRRQSQWARRYWRHVLANEPGPHHYEPKVRPSAPPFPRSVIEEMGAILGRAIDADATNSDVLDVDESLRLTLRAGMAPQLKFRSPPLNVPVLVLRDTAWQMRPWDTKVEYFVRELRRQGVVLEQWFFAGDPLHVSRAVDGPTIALETLAASRSGLSLMILSSGQAVSTQSLRELARLLNKWKYRTWIHPATHPRYWRLELNVLPLRIWPMTRAGVRGAAVEISPRGDMGVPPKMTPARSVTRVDVERMKQLLALAPAPSLELAQEMRRRFCPEVPEEVMLFLGAEGVFYGEAIAFPPQQLQELLAAAGRDPEREQKVRRYLLEVLHDSQPPGESAAYLRWQLDEAIQRLKLDPNDGSARDTIHDLADGPLREEVQSAVSLHGVDVSVPVAMPKQLPAQPPASLGKRPPSLAWPPLAATAITVAVIVPLTVLASRSMKAGAGTPIAHLRGAYTLRWDANATRLLGGIASPNAPPTVDLYRDGRQYLNSTDLRRVAEFHVRPQDTGAWFDLRAKLPKGNLATSHPVWVAPASRPQWPGDEIARSIVTYVSEYTKKPERDLQEGTSLASLTPAPGSLLEAISGKFKVTLPITGDHVPTTIGQVADLVRAQLAEVKAGEVTLAFVSPEGKPLDGIRYTLRDSSNMTQAGVGGNPIAVAPATYRVIVLNPAVTNRLNVGSVTVRSGERVKSAFVLRTRPEWYRDAISRRVVTIIMAQLNLTEEAVEPNSDIRRELGADDRAKAELLKAVEEEFGIAITDRDAERLDTPQQLVDFVRAATNGRGKNVEAVLTFLSRSGAEYHNVTYQLVGVREDFIGEDGEPLSVSPGQYRVVAQVYGLRWELGTVTIPAGSPFEQHINVPLDQRFVMTPDGYMTVSAKTAYDMLVLGKVVGVDLRPASEYKGSGGHIPGSINAPFETIERELPELLPYQTTTILVYGNDSAEGTNGAKLLTVAGFRYVVHLSGGIEAWRKQGYRTVMPQ